jgi:peptidoglycan hydrolase-like protein with peptidoglycan-binding domain
MLTRNLSLGSRGVDVISMQNFLIAHHFLPAGNNTGYFGNLTQAAVQSWQRSHGIVSSGTPTTTGYGAAGPRTRAALAHCN